MDRAQKRADFFKNCQLYYVNKLKYIRGNSELLKVIKDQMYTFNITFGNGTPTSDEDVSIGEKPVALRLIYEHFISGGSYTFEDFRRMCKNGIRDFTISQALRVILKDVNSDKDEDNHIKFV